MGPKSVHCIPAVVTWGSSWGGGKKIRIYCDNNSVCQILHHHNSKSPQCPLSCIHSIACQSGLGVWCQQHICQAWTTFWWIAFRGAGWRSSTLAVLRQPHFRQRLAPSYWISAMGRICGLDGHTVIWPHWLLTSARRIGQVAGFDPHRLAWLELLERGQGHRLVAVEVLWVRSVIADQEGSRLRCLQLWAMSPAAPAKCKWCAGAARSVRGGHSTWERWH